MAIQRRNLHWMDRIVTPLFLYGGGGIVALSFLLMLVAEKKNVDEMTIYVVVGGGIAGLGWIFSR